MCENVNFYIKTISSFSGRIEGDCYYFLTKKIMSNPSNPETEQQDRYAALCTGSLNEQAIMADYDGALDDAITNFAQRQAEATDVS